MLTNTVSASRSLTLNNQASLQVQHRIIAAWALAEGTLGGILHGLHIPVTGLVVGSISVCCLALLARLNRRPGNLLKATLLVLLIKAMLSPHSPIGAYVAVFCQGFVAELIFRSVRNFKSKSYIFGILTQLQSAIQHLIVITLVFGLDFWQAIDKYLNVVSKSLGLQGADYAFYVAGIYIGMHAVMGIVVGWVAGNLPEWLPKTPATFACKVAEAEPVKSSRRKKKKAFYQKRSGLAIIWLLLLLVFLQSYFGIGPQVLPQTKVAQILIRSVLIGSAWYFIVSPMLLKFFHKWLQHKKGPLQNELDAILILLPETKAIAIQSWEQSTYQTGIKRVLVFIKILGRELFTLPAEVL